MRRDASPMETSAAIVTIIVESMLIPATLKGRSQHRESLREGDAGHADVSTNPGHRTLPARRRNAAKAASLIGDDCEAPYLCLRKNKWVGSVSAASAREHLIDRTCGTLNLSVWVEEQAS